MDDFKHIPVLLDQAVDALNVKPDGVYIDGTAGGAGHSREIAKKLSGGLLIALDRDPKAVSVAAERLSGFNAKVIQSPFSQMREAAETLGIDSVDGVLLDLGVSSYQLDTPERGFSYHADAPLDMRMSGEGLSARDIVNEYDYISIRDILYKYGEENYAPSIAKAILAAREVKPIETTLELAEIVKNAVPQKVRRAKNPCKKTFQAIRIAVNDEFGQLDAALDTAFGMLKKGGRLAVITFHSLEDRMVKQRFAEFAKGCICPPDFPQCVCGRTPRGKIIFRKPVTAGEKELEDNPRSRSAKLRAVEKL